MATSDRTTVSNPPTASGPRAGTVLNERYVIRSRLRDDAFSFGFLAHDREQNDSVLLRVVRPTLARHPGTRSVEEGAKETVALLRPLIGVRGAFLPGVLDAGSDGPWVYVVEPLPKGVNLRQVIDQRVVEGTALKAEEVLPLISHLVAALEALPEGLAHGDVRADQVWLRPTGFALAGPFLVNALPRQAVASILQRHGDVRRRTAPESSTADRSPASDRFGVAAIAFEALTLRAPPEDGAAPTQDELGPLAEPLAALLHPEPGARPPLREFAEALAEVSGIPYRPLDAKPETPDSDKPRRRRRESHAPNDATQPRIQSKVDIEAPRELPTELPTVRRTLAEVEEELARYEASEAAKSRADDTEKTRAVPMPKAPLSDVPRLAATRQPGDLPKASAAPAAKALEETKSGTPKPISERPAFVDDSAESAHHLSVVDSAEAIEKRYREKQRIRTAAPLAEAEADEVDALLADLDASSPGLVDAPEARTESATEPAPASVLGVPQETANKTDRRSDPDIVSSFDKKKKRNLDDIGLDPRLVRAAKAPAKPKVDHVPLDPSVPVEAAAEGTQEVLLEELILDEDVASSEEINIDSGEIGDILPDIAPGRREPTEEITLDDLHEMERARKRAAVPSNVKPLPRARRKSEPNLAPAVAPLFDDSSIRPPVLDEQVTKPPPQQRQLQTAEQPRVSTPSTPPRVSRPRVNTAKTKAKPASRSQNYAIGLMIVLSAVLVAVVIIGGASLYAKSRREQNETDRQERLRQRFERLQRESQPAEARPITSMGLSNSLSSAIRSATIESTMRAPTGREGASEPQ